MSEERATWGSLSLTWASMSRPEFDLRVWDLNEPEAVSCAWFWPWAEHKTRNWIPNTGRIPASLMLTGTIFQPLFVRTSVHFWGLTAHPRIPHLTLPADLSASSKLPFYRHQWSFLLVQHNVGCQNVEVSALLLYPIWVELRSLLKYFRVKARRYFFFLESPSLFNSELSEAIDSIPRGMRSQESTYVLLHPLQVCIITEYCKYKWTRHSHGLSSVIQPRPLVCNSNFIAPTYCNHSHPIYSLSNGPSNVLRNGWWYSSKHVHALRTLWTIKDEVVFETLQPCDLPNC